MRILRAESYRRMPWKNGGGETTEIAVSPEGAGLDDFDWRVSMARVESSGPFSLFAGIDRTLAILEGEGHCARYRRPRAGRSNRSFRAIQLSGRRADQCQR